MHQITLALTLTLTVGCAIDLNATGDSVSSEPSALIAPCATGTWCLEAGPVNTAPLLHSVWAVSASDVFAVGDKGTIMRRSSTGWTAMSSGTTQNLRGVWAASSSNVWAVGLGGTILRFNGTSWSTVTGVTTSDLDAVWGSSANDVWLGATGTVLHWNGTSFSTSTSFAGHIRSISGSGPNDVWVTGENTMVHHFTGTWLPAISPGVGTNTFFAVLAVASGNVWVTDSTMAKESVHLTAGSWVPKSTSGAFFEGMTAFGANDIWGVGLSTSIGHWNGTVWAITGPFGSIGTLWSATSAPSNAWAVGDFGLIAHLAL
jgi:hypothetical protein